MTSRKSFNLIVAATESGGIGMAGNLPWRLPGDMAFFKSTTLATFNSAKRNALIMGRKTWESIPTKFRPLEGRLNIVLSRNENIRDDLAIPEGVLTFTSLERALDTLNSTEMSDTIENVWVIGGGALYAHALTLPECGSLYITRIYNEFECDTVFPAFSRKRFPLHSMSDLKEEKGIKYQFMQYTNPELETSAGIPLSLNAAVDEASKDVHEEMQYLNIVKDIIENGVARGDRTGTGTLSKFGVTMRFSLRNNVLPLLTTKRVFWRGVAEELLWFVSGDTSAKSLQDKDIHIWDGNASREYFDRIGLTDREEGDLGPVYGFQWRHFGAKYTDMHADYKGQGVDQLAQAIEKIKHKPTDRRIIVSAWNPADIHLMALPPCHMFCQFFVANGELSCQMYQRSADMGLGVPFNIASYSLLTVMMAQCTGLKPGEFVHVIGDAHVYSNHVEPLKEQLKRVPRPFPTLHIKTDTTDIDGFKYDDFEVKGYKPHKKIKMEMAV